MTSSTTLNSGTKKNHQSFWLVVVTFFIICVAFPTRNSSIDAYAFGYSVKWGVELFYSHHILYSPLIYFLHKIFINLGFEIDALNFGKYINAFFASATMVFLYKILLYLNRSNDKSIALILFVAASFSVLRFSTENETYILPVFFSVAGMYYLTKDYLSPATFHLFLGALTLATACLFHTIHFFWWMAALAGVFFFAKNFKDRIKVFIIFFTTGCVVPAIYSLILVYGLNTELSINSFFDYLLYDFKSGNVQTNFSYDNIKLSFINLIRTFFQFHGNIIYLLHKYPSLYFTFPLVLALIYNSLFPLIRIKYSNTFPKINFIVFCALMLHIFCAIFAVGNIEFMVMIPFLTCLVLNIFNVPVARLVFLSMAMLVWNLTFAIIPDSHINYFNTKSQLQYVQNNPDKTLIFSQAVLLNNMYYYNTGRNPLNLHVFDTQNVQKIDTLVKNTYNSVLTDVVKNPEPISRNSILNEELNEAFFHNFTLVPIDSLETFYGMRKIYQLKK